MLIDKEQCFIVTLPCLFRCIAVKTDLEKILKTVERISFSVIGLMAAFFLLNTVVNLGPGTYGRELLNGVSIYLTIGSFFILLWVLYNVIKYSGPEHSKNN